MKKHASALIASAILSAGVSASTYPEYVPRELSSLPQGTLLFGRDDMSGFSTGTVQTVTDQPFTSALRISVASPAAFPWDVNIRIGVPRAVAKDDVMLMVFWARAVSGQPETSEGWISALFEKSSPDWNKSFSGDVTPGPLWKQYVFPFSCDNAYGPDESHWGFNFGAIAQVIEIGGVELINFGTAVTLARLEPFRTRLSYSGMEPDSPWRADAAGRIERLRKADCILTLLNNGAPAEGAGVEVEMIRHAFGFGTAINAGLVSATDETVYMQKIKLNFNKAVIENDLKWRYWSGSTETKARTAIDWLTGEGIDVRGHVLVWPSWRNMPESVSRDSAVLAGQILDHIEYAVTMFKEKLVEWDVINEPYDNHDAIDLLGSRAMIDWFNAAHAADPAARLYINDYGIVAGNDSSHRDHYFNTISYLVDNGAPVQGIGVQCHFGQTPVAPTEVLRRLDRFASFGLPIQVTEFDVNTTDEELQAAYTHDFLTTVFSHPAVTGFLMWGFWENAHWLPDGAMYRADWSEKPNLHAYRSLVFDAWRTRESLVTDASGACGFRGFKGAYRITVTIDGVDSAFDCLLTENSDIAYDFSTGELTVREKTPKPGNLVLMELHAVSRGRRTTVFSVRGAANQDWTLLVTDSAGRTIRRVTGKGPEEVELSAGRRPTHGAYCVRLSWNGGTISKRIFAGR